LLLERQTDFDFRFSTQRIAGEFWHRGGHATSLSHRKPEIDDDRKTNAAKTQKKYKLGAGMKNLSPSHRKQHNTNEQNEPRSGRKPDRSRHRFTGAIASIELFRFVQHSMAVR
jgi:hypothetical protein